MAKINKDDLIFGVTFHKCSGCDRKYEWISVEEGLPAESGEYFVYTKAGIMDVLVYSERHEAFNAFDDLGDADMAIPCTHWMPLPERPK